MKIDDKRLIKLIAKKVGVLAALFVACKFTQGLAATSVVAIGVWGALSSRTGIAMSCYILFPLLIIMNPYVVSIGGVAGAILRIGFLVMTFLLMFAAAKRKGNQNVPLGGLWAYVLVALISSMGGYAPTISYLKLINFSLFILGITLGLRNIDKNPEGLMYMRSFLLAIACVIIFGSLATLPFPGVAYFISFQQEIKELGVEGVSMAAKSGSSALFCGITNQSQCLGPLSVMTIVWVMCDMLFVERRISILHGALMVCGLPVMYMTRSRTALLALVVGLFMIYTYCFHYLSVSPRVKMALRSGITGTFALIALAAIVLEVKDHSISRWVRKTDDVSGDQRSVAEAFTASRMGKVEENLYDFRRNPLLGSGFQVAYEFQYIYKPGQIVMSAPIEKGVLPVMVLGETGVLGAAVFAVFIFIFYGVCSTKRYAVTATLFTVLMASNMGESTFFSTGGVGGILWVMGMVGGFCIDMIVRSRKNMMMVAGGMPMMPVRKGAYGR